MSGPQGTNRRDGMVVEQSRLYFTVYSAMALWLGAMWLTIAVGRNVDSPAWIQWIFDLLVIQSEWWIALVAFFAFAGIVYATIRFLESRDIIKLTAFARMGSVYRWVMVIPVVVLAGGLVMAISDANIYSGDVDPGKAEDAEGGMPDAFSDPLFLSLTGLAILLIAALAYWQLRKKRAENRLKETMQAAQSAFRPHLLECLLDVRKIVETESDWEKVQPQVFDILQERLDGWNLRGIRGNSIAGRLASAMVDFAGLPERLAADVVDSLRLPHDDFPPQVKIEREEAANALTEAISLLRSLAKVAEPAA